METLEIKTEFVADVSHSFSENDIYDENQESDPLAEKIDGQSEIVEEDVQYYDEQGELCDQGENHENGDFSSELTLASEEQSSEPKVNEHDLKNGKRKKTYTCELCNQTFLRSYQLNRHNFIGIHKRKSPNGTPATEQPNNNITNESQWYDIKNVFHEDEKYYKCSFCNQASTDLKVLDEHNQEHNGKAFSYTCKMCDKVLPYPNYLKNHVISHTLNYFHTCDICERSFSTLPSLIKHEHSCHGKGMQTRGQRLQNNPKIIP